MVNLGTGAGNLNLSFQIGSARSITFDFNSDISGYTFEFVLRAYKGGRTKILSLTAGNGLTYPIYSDSLLASFSVANTSIEQAEYYWELRRTDLNIPWLYGLAFFEFDGSQGDGNSSVDIDIVSTTISVSISNGNIIAATQSQVNAGSNNTNFVTPSTLASKALLAGTYSTTLTFSTDQDIYHDSTGASIVFTLAGSGNINGVGIILRLNKPTSVTFPSNFEADPNSSSLDSTKLNVYFLLYFSNWNGSGTARVIYTNHLFTSL